jgi:hypothetical protein
MRSHGVANWPDPTRYPRHPDRPTFELQPLGIDPNSPQVVTRVRECEPLLHGNNPQHLGGEGAVVDSERRTPARLAQLDY